MFTRLFHLQMAVFYHQFDKIMNLCKHRLASQGSYAYTITVVYRHGNNNTFALMQEMKKHNI